MSYECERCGACCRHWIVEADLVDVLREPRIAAECALMDGYGKLPLDSDSVWMIACGPSESCPFQRGNECDIYPTRPSECVAFSPGSLKCAECRTAAGLRPLVERESDGSLMDRCRNVARVTNDDEE